jgi:hypothetical protein
MRLTRLEARSRRTARRRIWAVGLALLAMLLQLGAPIAVAPPPGQPVHFAHSHDEHGTDAGDQRAPQEAPACPICLAMQAGSAALTAPFLATGPCLGAPHAPTAEARLEPRSAHFDRAHRARAPPASGA